MDERYIRSRFLKVITDGLKEARKGGSNPEEKRAVVLVARSVLRRKLFTMEEMGTSEEELAFLEKIVVN